MVAGDQYGVPAWYLTDIFGDVSGGIDLLSLLPGLKPGTFSWRAFSIIGSLAEVEARMPGLLSSLPSSVDATVYDGDLYALVTAQTAMTPIQLSGSWYYGGRDGGTLASAIYDPAYYATVNTTATTPKALINHFIKVDQGNGVRASLEFDPVFYLGNNADVAAATASDPKAAGTHWQVTGIDERS